MKTIQNTLYWRIAGLMVVVLSILAVIYFFVAVQMSKSYFNETTQKLNRNVAKQMLLEVNPFKNGIVQEEAIGKIMHSMMAVNPNLEVYILSPKGEILAFVVLDKKVKLKSVDIEPVKQFLANEKLVYGDNPRIIGEKVIFSASPVFENEILQGYIYMTLQSEKEIAINTFLFKSYLLSVSAKYFFITLTAAIVISLLLLYFLVRRLSQIISMIREFSTGNHQVRVQDIGSGELSSMANDINKMADTIVKNIEELKEVDILRRELIANISHDLRTPVSVIHGYAETLIIKYEDISNDKKKEYLEIIIQTSEKLKLLMNDLFELSRLEARNITPVMENFDLIILLKELSEKFKPMASCKHIEISQNYPPNNINIKADIKMIERVFQNLIENAVKYTPEKGEIDINILENKDNVCINIKNSGTGIAENDLPKIFNRYYKNDTNKVNNSSGLGLAIVKNILDIHNFSIKVNSKQNIETEFSLILPIAK